MNEFEVDEWLYLSTHLRLVKAGNPDQTTQNIAVTALLDPEQCDRFLGMLMPMIHAPSKKITASLLSKRWGFLSTASCLYAMSVYNKGLDFSAHNCLLDYSFANPLWQSNMPVIDLSVTTPFAGQRDAWRDQLLTQLFAQHLAPLWQVMTEVTGVQSRILWENTAVRVYSLYENRINQLNCPQLRQQTEADFYYLCNDAPASIFGIAENPLKRFNHPKITLLDTGKEVRFRKSCCFYYKASEPIEYCKSCPLIKPSNKKKRLHVSH